MPEIRLPGLSTGLDTGKLVEQLVAVESRKVTILEQDKLTKQDEYNAMQELESELRSVRTKARALANSSQLKSYAATTTDKDVMTASATSEAIEGNHSVQVKQLATASRFVHDGLEFKEDYVGSGSGIEYLILAYNNQEMVITVDHSEPKTLEELVGSINNAADNPGINASLLQYDDGSGGVYHLVLSGQESGSDYQIKINDSTTNVVTSTEESLLNYNSSAASVSTKIQNLDRFESSTWSGDETITISGTDYLGNAITDVNLTVTSNTKISHLLSKINEAFDGYATATYVDGEFRLMDDENGYNNVTRLDVTFNDADSSLGAYTALSFETKTEDQGGQKSDILTGFEESTFTATQVAQDSLLRVDDYPPVVQEVQTLSVTSGSFTGGTFTLTYDGEETDPIAYDADAATIQTALEALSNVTAGDITVSGSALSAGGPLTFTFDGELDDVDLLEYDSALLTGTGTLDIAETTKGEDGWIRRSSNTVDDVLTGVTMRLHDTTYDSTSGDYDTIELNLSRDTEELEGKVQALVDAYNSLVGFYEEYASYDPDTEESGPLFGDYGVVIVRSTIKTIFQSAVSGFGGDDAFTLPSDIGIEFNNDGTLKFDSNTFNQALNSDYSDLLALLGAQKTGNITGRSESGDTPSKFSFYGASESITKAGSYIIDVTVSGGEISSAKIQKVGESTWRDMEFETGSGVVTGSLDLNDNKQYNYDEAGLQVSVDLDTDGSYTAQVNVKQGFAGNIEDQLDEMLHSVDGRIPISLDALDEKLDNLNDRIDTEKERLADFEERLVLRYARLERDMQLLQQQFAGLNML